MPVRNAEIVRIFDTLADLLEIEEANPFRVRAYRNAARIVDSLSQDVAQMVSQGRHLEELPGIGKDLAEKIATVVHTGKLPLLEEVEQRIPKALSTLTHIPGLGPKRVKALYQQLNIDSLEDLQQAVDTGAVRTLPGFGERTEQIIREGIQRLRSVGGRMRLFDAQRVAHGLKEHLQGVHGVKAVEVAGSYRRCRETVGDLDILVSCARGSPVAEAFVNYPSVSEVLAKGATKSTVRLYSGLQVDLRVVPEVSFGAALHYFTGSKSHNIAVRKLGVKAGLKINEYGVFRGEKRVAGKAEWEVFKQVGLPFIPPELREDRGEIEAAQEGRLPKLVERTDIRGDLHTHTPATDGRSTPLELAEAAKARGYEYLAITDHSKQVAIAHGLDEKGLRLQLEEIDRLNDQLEGITLLKGIEVDILRDGSLDLPDSVLANLDLTVCALHSRYNLNRTQQTERVLRAMDNSHCTILAHPIGRLINERDPTDLDLERVIMGAAQRGCFLELNASPSRLDLDDLACRFAKEQGVLIAISTDAHAAAELAYMELGIGQARRGWLEAGDVLNSRPLKALSKLLKR